MPIYIPGTKEREEVERTTEPSALRRLSFLQRDSVEDLIKRGYSLLEALDIKGEVLPTEDSTEITCIEGAIRDDMAYPQAINYCLTSNGQINGQANGQNGQDFAESEKWMSLIKGNWLMIALSLGAYFLLKDKF